MALIGFPREVNEKAARTVAGGVMLLAVIALVTGWRWLPALMAVGFALRVVAGPRFSPLGRLAAQVIAPRLGTAIPTAGPPKRFAQAIGLSFTTAAALAWLVFDAHTLGLVLLAVLLVFATLEAVLGFCAGCYVFGHLMRWGVVPEDTCEACNNIALRREQTV
ncbi:DUF4395 domain-containing protein [Calidifontibacter indicus]|uniref:DUF4395 domain-containing protein n=1 Tax=Calidifontibacter indicus TaxID=419650 RepID=UPI003D72B551